MRISDWSSDVCSSDLSVALASGPEQQRLAGQAFGQLRDRASGHAETIGQFARRQRLVVVQLAQRHPLRDGHPTRRQLQAEGVGDLVRDVAQPIAEMGVERADHGDAPVGRSEEHTSELQSLMRISYAVFCLKKKKKKIVI